MWPFKKKEKKPVKYQFYWNNAWDLAYKCQDCGEYFKPNRVCKFCGSLNDHNECSRRLIFYKVFYNRAYELWVPKYVGFEVRINDTYECISFDTNSYEIHNQLKEWYSLNKTKEIQEDSNK